MNDDAPASRRVRLADLPAGKGLDFRVAPAAPERADLAGRLGLAALRKLRFEGRLAPLGDDGWELAARLGATVVQDCVATLEPVVTRIDEEVTRRYLARMPDLPPGSEIEMPEDETLEPLPDALDLAEVMFEALALAVPAFPRRDGAEAAGAALADPPPDEADGGGGERPFAGLGDLLAKR